MIWIIAVRPGGLAGPVLPRRARASSALRQVKADEALGRDPGSAPRPDRIMFLAMTASVILVVSTILVLYETLRLTSEHLSELPIPPRMRILAVVLMTFIGHTVAVWIYAGAYWILVLRLGVGAFAGAPVTSFEDCLYFSVVAYTSLGFGDHFPTSHTRLLAGVEALNGLLLIGWSASFTYLAMERYWPLHGKARAHQAAKAGRGGEPGRERLFPPAPGA
ncbi:potassium channel family protein [Methylobacterium sp. P31]